MGHEAIDSLLAESSVPVLVFTGDEQLLSTLSSTGGGQHPVHGTSEEAAAMALLARLAPGVLVVDASVCPDVPGLCARMHRHQPGLVTVVVADRALAGDLMRLVGEDGVLRVLPAPLSAGQARLALEAAVRRHLALAAVQHDELPDAHRSADSPPPASKGPRAALFAGSAVAVVVLAAGGAWLLLGDDLAPSPPASAVLDGGGELAGGRSLAQASVPVQVPADTGAGSGDVPALERARLLEQAEAALAAGRLLGPAPESAEALFRGVLAADPANGRARLGLERVWLAEMALAEQAVVAGELSLAEQRLQAVAERVPGHPRLLMLRERLRQATQVPLETSAAADDPVAVVAESVPVDAIPAEPPAEEAALASDEALALARAQRDLLALVQARLTGGALVSPRGDSALDYLQALRETGASPAMLFVAEQQLARAFLVQAESALAQGGFADAEQALARARALGVVPLEIAAAERTLARARRLAEARLRVVPESTLERLDYHAPEYPRRAYRSNQEGWVELGFSVGLDGYPMDIRVLAAEPPGVFEESATAALARWRYRPVEFEGQAIEQRAEVRIRFEIR